VPPGSNRQSPWKTALSIAYGWRAGSGPDFAPRRCREDRDGPMEEYSVGLNYKRRLSRSPKYALLHINQVAKSSGVP